MAYDKSYLREIMAIQKAETLEKHAKLINQFRADYYTNIKLDCDLLVGNISIDVCETPTEKRRWAAYVHLSTSLPYRGAVGRRIQLFVRCDDVIIGMVQICSPMAQNRHRDQYIGWANKEEKWKCVNDCYNIGVCVPVSKYAPLLTGKLLVYLIFSLKIKDYLINKYGGNCLGFETTALYGRSSMYNRIPFLPYLGTTDGYSAVPLSDDEWKKAYNEWLDKCSHHKQAGETNRLAEVKYQILAKLEGWYKQNKIPFPYTYKRAETKRGVYFGYAKDVPVEQVRVEEWRERWLKGRLARGYAPLNLED